MYQPKFSEAKLGELMLYIASHLSSDPFFGRTKLNKVLFFSDFAAFLKSGFSITGATYRRLDFGPVPEQVRATLDQLRKSGSAEEVQRDLIGFQQHRLVPLRDPRLDSFTGTELELVDQVIEMVASRSAKEVSELSHRLSVGWQLAKEGEVIPYETAFLRPTGLSPREREIVVGRAQELGLLSAAS